MLGLRFRISRKDWDARLEGARSFRLENLQIRTKSAEKPLFSVVVSKKVSKLSVRRHEIKRFIYQWIGNNMETIGSRVFVVFVNKNKENMEDYLHDLQKALHESK